MKYRQAIVGALKEIFHVKDLDCMYAVRTVFDQTPGVE